MCCITYNGTKSDVSATVNGDGSTVLNVYYDRLTMTFNFYTGSEYTFDSSSYYYDSSYQYWGTKSGSDRIPLYYVDRNTLKNAEGNTYNGTVYYTNDSSTTSYYGTLIYTLTGLYGAPLTGWPHAAGKGWNYYINSTGYQLSLQWSQFIITPTPTDNTQTWNLYQASSNTGVTIHYIGETLNDTAPSDTQIAAVEA